jgi:hypothetical protein
MTGGPLLCPSADVTSPDAHVIGVVLGSPQEPRVSPLRRPVPITDEIVARTAPLPPTRILRIAAACREDSCRHFSDGQCAFAAKVVRMLPAVADALPHCVIRAECRWFAQEGRPACLRCPQVVTENPDLSPPMALAGNPLVPVPPRPDDHEAANPVRPGER